MEILLLCYKIILIIALLFIVSNIIRVNFNVLKSITNHSEIDINQIGKAKNSFYVVVVSIWLTATMLFFFEKSLLGFTTLFVPMLFYYTGIIIILISLINSLVVIIGEIKRHKNNKQSIYRFSVEYKNSLIVSFFLITLVWMTLWFLS